MKLKAFPNNMRKNGKVLFKFGKTYCQSLFFICGLLKMVQTNFEPYLLNKNVKSNFNFNIQIMLLEMYRKSMNTFNDLI